MERKATTYPRLKIALVKSVALINLTQFSDSSSQSKKYLNPSFLFFKNFQEVFPWECPKRSHIQHACLVPMVYKYLTSGMPLIATGR